MKHVEGTAYTIDDLTKEDQDKLRNEIVQVYVGNYGRIPTDEEVNTATTVVCCLTLGNPFFNPLEPIKAKLTNKLGRMPTLEEVSAAVREKPPITLRSFIEEVWKFVEPSPDGKSICGIPHPIPSVSIGEELPKGEN